MRDPFILAIDQGTTSSRAIAFSKAGDILAVSQKELPAIYPHKGWVEQNADQIWYDTLATCRDVLGKLEDAPCAAIGITNQRETTILWDKKTGTPVYNAIVWQDRRTAERCKDFKAQDIEPLITKKTGLLCDPYFSASKIQWIFEQDAGLKSRALDGDILFGTIETFLLWKLTEGKVHASDITNASRTGLYNIVDQDWDEDLLKLYDIPPAILPEVHDNAYGFGETDMFGGTIPISGMAGDQQAALIGQACFKPGMMKSTYGTGCFALMNIGDTFKASENRLLTTVGYRLNGNITYALEGSIFMAGAVIQWLRDNLGIIKTAAESEDLARSVADNNGIYLIPAFTGLGAPHWLPEARAAITGLTRDSTKAHIARAALEAQAYQTLDLLMAMEADSGIFPEILRADGGLTANAFMCEFLADLLQIPVELPRVTETTALGAAYLAGLHVGVYASPDEIAGQWAQDKLFSPKADKSKMAGLYQSWQRIIADHLTKGLRGHNL